MKRETEEGIGDCEFYHPIRESLLSLWCGPEGCPRDGDDCCRVGLERGSNDRSPALSKPLDSPFDAHSSRGLHKINALANHNEASCNYADQLRLVDQTFSNGPLGYVVVVPSPYDPMAKVRKNTARVKK